MRVLLTLLITPKKHIRKRRILIILGQCEREKGNGRIIPITNIAYQTHSQGQQDAGLI